jgi:hypothetical protein
MTSKTSVPMLGVTAALIKIGEILHTPAAIPLAPNCFVLFPLLTEVLCNDSPRFPNGAANARNQCGCWCTWDCPASIESVEEPGSILMGASQAICDGLLECILKDDKSTYNYYGMNGG